MYLTLLTLNLRYAIKWNTIYSIEIENHINRHNIADIYHIWMHYVTAKYNLP